MQWALKRLWLDSMVPLVSLAADKTNGFLQAIVGVRELVGRVLLWTLCGSACSCAHDLVCSVCRSKVGGKRIVDKPASYLVEELWCKLFCLEQVLVQGHPTHTHKHTRTRMLTVLTISGLLICFMSLTLTVDRRSRGTTLLYSMIPLMMLSMR